MPTAAPEAMTTIAIMTFVSSDSIAFHLLKLEAIIRTMARTTIPATRLKTRALELIIEDSFMLVLSMLS